MKLWITYAWKDNEEGNFDFIVQELKKVGIEAIYDRVALVPGQRLWEQISNKIINDDFDGWAYLITPNSITSQPCKEELEYAINRTLEQKAGNFPLIGLVHNLPFAEVPISMRVRLCVALKSPNWCEEVKAGLQLRPPTTINTPQTQYICKVFEQYNGTTKSTVVEIRPRFGEIKFWRVAVPKNIPVSRWGCGSVDGTDSMSGILYEVIENADGTINGTQVTGFGAGDTLTSNNAVKIVFDNQIPDFIGFGLCEEPPYGAIGQMEIYKFK